MFDFLQPKQMKASVEELLVLLGLSDAERFRHAGVKVVPDQEDMMDEEVFMFFSCIFIFFAIIFMMILPIAWPKFGMYLNKKRLDYEKAGMIPVREEIGLGLWRRFVFWVEDFGMDLAEDDNVEYENACLQEMAEMERKTLQKQADEKKAKAAEKEAKRLERERLGKLGWFESKSKK
jgi:signal transduction histidine kinase